MLKTQLKHLAELALIRAIPDMTVGELKPSRTKGLFNKLQKQVDKDLYKIPRPDKNELDKVWDLITTFGKKTGWLEQRKHTGTLISFCLGMIERSDFKFNPGILDILNKLVDHFENGNDFKVQSAWSGDLAAEKWEGLF